MAAKKSKKSPSKRDEWVDDALLLKAKGNPIAEVARKLKKPATTVRDRIHDETADPADVLKRRRATKDAQLEAIIDGFYDAATTGDPQAAAIVVSVVKEQIRLHGLAAPEKIDINAKVSMVHDSTSTILNLLTKFEEDARPGDAKEVGAPPPVEAGRDDAAPAAAVPCDPQP